MSVHRFTVPGSPVTWKRARRGGGRSYTDPKDKAHREKIRAYARNAGVRQPIQGPVSLSLAFFLPADPLAARSGDLDNYEKAVKDALQGIAFVNDRQVTDVVKQKRIDVAHPRTEIVLASGWPVDGWDAYEQSEAEAMAPRQAGKAEDVPA